MAKKKDKDADTSRAGRAETVRSAVDQAFSASAAQAEQGRERAQDIVDQLAQAAGRVRDVIEELRPPTGDELRTLRETVDRLERRVTALEAAQAKPRRATSTARKPAKGTSKSSSKA